MFDAINRPFVGYAAPFDNAPGLHDVQGNIAVINPNGAAVNLSAKANKVDLKVNNK